MVVYYIMLKEVSMLDYLGLVISCFGHCVFILRAWIWTVVQIPFHKIYIIACLIFIISKRLLHRVSFQF